MSRLVSLLFDTAQARAAAMELHREPCDLAAMVREQVDALRVANPRHTIDLTIPSHDRTVRVVADADRIGQVVMNYLSNALKYSPEDQRIAVQVEVKDAWAQVSVADRGPGIPVGEQERIWQRFYRVQDGHVRNGSNSGLGLGLHICETIVKQHGGQVGLDSAVGAGSTFWFTLPLE
jgi:signal transduction histidine kinase